LVAGDAPRSTENAEVCARLVADLVDRGLDASRGILFMIDGGKGACYGDSEFGTT
jgi:hypothetical protein